jgi:hypothetical protein
VLDQAPLAGGVYLVQYEFMSAGACRATCQRLLAGSDGSLLATECGPGEPPTTGSIPDAAAQSARSSVGTSGGETTTSTPRSDEFGD